MAHPNELPNTCLFVSVSTSLKSNWTPIGATEIIESALIGETITTIKVLLDSSSLLFPLRDDCSPIPVKYEGLETTFPSIVVQSRKQKPLDPTAAKVMHNIISFHALFLLLCCLLKYSENNKVIFDFFLCMNCYDGHTLE
ncbi:unnamed protein product [Schistosoma mattheei]|uniref:Uncharacterized protein n=1 Tax=Schistosoma mattheei TaxID=31246 RepID=A0A183NI86_9TREM|nr:unnamed protein product [Schistosoma mattheei]